MVGIVRLIKRVLRRSTTRIGATGGTSRGRFNPRFDEASEDRSGDRGATYRNEERSGIDSNFGSVKLQPDLLVTATTCDNARVATADANVKVVVTTTRLRSEVEKILSFSRSCRIEELKSGSELVPW